MKQNDTQPAPKASEGDLWKDVIDDMMNRRKLGIDRYGTPLQPFNGRDSLQDAYEEALDLAVYLKQKITEEKRSHSLDDSEGLVYPDLESLNTDDTRIADHAVRDLIQVFKRIEGFVRTQSNLQFAALCDKYPGQVHALDKPYLTVGERGDGAPPVTDFAITRKIGTLPVGKVAWCIANAPDDRMLTLGNMLEEVYVPFLEAGHHVYIHTIARLSGVTTMTRIGFTTRYLVQKD